ncbi:MAG: hypothetical protein M3O34_20735, partial [Chloroflexota bacterium]|nr:hypothetical protein [Chloroflexota bacterium]
MGDDATGPSGDGPLRIGLLRETYDLALSVAGDVWPTPAMALANLFERGVTFLASGGTLAGMRGGAPPELLRTLNQTRDELLTLEASYWLVRYVTFVLTRDSEELEATWLGLADQHLAIRAEIVAFRREEERLKRELTRYGEPMVPLPEHDELAEIPPDRPRKSRGMYATLFEGAEEVIVSLDIDPAVVDAAERLARERGWAGEWGEHARLSVLTHGLSLAMREREADAIDPDDETSVRAGISEARGRAMGLEGRYATLRLRLFELRHNHRILGWRIRALQVEAQGMRRRLDLFIEDRDRLQAMLDARRASGPPPPARTEPAP